MENKVAELGVFTIGLGLIGAALLGYTAYLEPPRDAAETSLVAGLLIPGVLVLLGSLTLLLREEFLVRATHVLLIAGWLLGAVLSLNPIGILIAIGAAYLVTKTANQAVEQIRLGATRTAPAPDSSAGDTPGVRDRGT